MRALASLVLLAALTAACAKKASSPTGATSTPASQAASPAAAAAAQPVAPPGSSPFRPDPAITPGDVLTTDPKVICVPGYTKRVRKVPTSLKNRVYRQYGITTRKPGEFEVDHLISLELGGSNSIRNLWPESYVTTPLNAHVKDKLENKLHDLACSGKITMAQAQRAIATDWVAAYRKYLGPLPAGRQAGGR